MDPTLAALTLRDRVWVICEHHRIAQRGIVVTVNSDTVTVRLPTSCLPPQRYDRATGMWAPEQGPKMSNTFFIRTELPPRFLNRHARPEYLVLDQTEERSYAAA